MALTALEIKSVSCPPDKNQIKKFDIKYLFLLAKSNDSKLWRLRYKYAGKHQEMALGKSAIPERFQNFATSGIEIEITPDMALPLEINLDDYR